LHVFLKLNSQRLNKLEIYFPVKENLIGFPLGSDLGIQPANAIWFHHPIMLMDRKRECRKHTSFLTIAVHR
jgi:hypothetical protein